MSGGDLKAQQYTILLFYVSYVLSVNVNVPMFAPNDSSNVCVCYNV